MNIVGALAKSHTKSVVYFCEYEAGEIENEKLLKLYEETRCEIPEEREIRIVVVESDDNMENDKRLVGVMIETPDKLKGVLLKGHEDLDIYLRDLI